MLKTPNITVVLTVYKRSGNFELQINALLTQTIKPKEILVWENGEEFVPNEFREKVTITRSHINLGVWARFAHALNADGEFICIFDDDTIPGPEWLENCYETMLATPGLLGTRGLVFESPLTYSLYREIGLYGQNEKTEKVDIVGHCWFFRREWLSVYWFEFGNQFQSKLAGEDLHFSYALQKHLNLPTLVPPHPRGEPEKWGSNPELALQLGGDKESISKSKESLRRFENAFQHYRKLGFKLIVESNIVKPRFPKIIYFLVQKQPKLMHYLAAKIKILKSD